MLKARHIFSVMMTTALLATSAHADSLKVGDWVTLQDAPGQNADHGGGAFIMTVLDRAGIGLRGTLEAQDDVAPPDARLVLRHVRLGDAPADQGADDPAGDAAGAGTGEARGQRPGDDQVQAGDDQAGADRRDVPGLRRVFR